MKKKKLRIRAIFILIITLAFPILCVTSARADAVTDNLSVAVGYAGMELNEYVEVGDYHWSELASNLPIYEQAYSYYNSRSDDGTEFTEIVDSARGILLIDLLNYANIYYGDIYNLQFYVVDHDDIQAAFDRDALFQTRYYFEDYNGHLYREYDDDFNVVSVDSSECWDYCEVVEPMLALEDNWVSFTEEYEHSLPDFENMSTSSRFRLLFGQTSPEESLTSKSAKYVRTVYVTLVGKPEIRGKGEDGELQELDKSIGSHQIEVEVSVNTTIDSAAVEELLNLESTDETVMIVDGWKATPDEFYQDIVHVTIDYQIIGEGEASIVGSFGSLEDGDTGFYFSKPVEAGTEDPSEDPPEEPEDKPVEPEDPEDPPVEPEDKPVEQNESGDDSKTAQQTPNPDDNGDTNGSQGSGQNTATTDTGDQSADASAVNAAGRAAAAGLQDLADATELKQLDEEKLKTEQSEVVDLDDRSVSSGIFRLSDNVRTQLEEGQSVRTDVAVVPTEDVTQLTIEDHTQEKNERMQRMLMIAGAGSAGLLALGCVGEKLAFFLGTRA